MRSSRRKESMKIIKCPSHSLSAPRQIGFCMIPVCFSHPLMIHFDRFIDLKLKMIQCQWVSVAPKSTSFKKGTQKIHKENLPNLYENTFWLKNLLILLYFVMKPKFQLINIWAKIWFWQRNLWRFLFPY